DIHILSLHDALPIDMNGIVLRIGHDTQQALTGPERSFADYFHAMLSDFLRSIAGGAAPAIDAASVVPSIRAIAQCYTNASRLEADRKSTRLNSSHVS